MDAIAVWNISWLQTLIHSVQSLSFGFGKVLWFSDRLIPGTWINCGGKYPRFSYWSGVIAPTKHLSQMSKGEEDDETVTFLVVRTSDAQRKEVSRISAIWCCLMRSTKMICTHAFVFTCYLVVVIELYSSLSRLLYHYPKSWEIWKRHWQRNLILDP